MKRIFVLSVMAFFLFMSCSKKEVKPVSMESLTAQEAIETIEKVKTAYIKKDESSLRRYTSEEGFSSNFTVKSMGFSSAELSFTPLWVDIKGGTVQVQISWTGKWVYHGQSIGEKGVAGFVLTGSPYRMNMVLKDNPFTVVAGK
ncbi:MAG: hypothetical protein H7844_14960 [Nitrospirae bacterium YQR-1]